MRPFLRFLILSVVVVSLSGCAAAAVSSAAWVGSEVAADKTPLDFMAEFFERDCDNMTIYDQPPRCRR